MGKEEKMIERIKACPRDYTYSELKRLMKELKELEVV